MIRIDGPFGVETKEGILTCNDWWLALDVDGDPYLIDDDIQSRSYEAVNF